jgi:hypothetical protein
MPLVKIAIDNGQWHQGLPLKTLVHRVNAKLEGDEADRETIKKAMAQLFADSGQLEYRYVSRQRVTRKKSRTPRARFFAK